MNDFPILIVEDNPVSRRLLEKTLRKTGHEVASVANGQKALALYKERFFPIVLTDWMMPEMNGLELCRAIRDRFINNYVFILLLTARDSKHDIVVGLEAGADDYLTKPFSLSELVARINTGIRILKLEESLKKAAEAVRILSITDSLTGCFNRGYMTERLSQEIERAKRYKHPLTIVLCDIDCFKKVNDTYGHQAGDRVLKEFVQCIQESIRDKVDWIARYGGEEFLIVLPETDINGAAIMAERLRQVVFQKVITLEKKEVNITSSFGVTGFGFIGSQDEISHDLMISQVDQYLYQAKREGRNRVKSGPLPVNKPKSELK